MAAAGVYIADALVDEGEEGREYVLEGLPRLRRFAQRCVEQGSGAIAVMS